MPIDLHALTQAKTHLAKVTRDINLVEVEDDREEEIDSLVNGLKFDSDVLAAGAMNQDNPAYLQPQSDLSNKRQKVTIEKYMENFKRASAQVLVENTIKEYER
ncbi:hypothetical protein PHLCEN_2v10957 [Hermanssonia centrifuga]|uniref:Uncharacterized protein n=1 Tax=Hermanssonia centrifuga TaxID=98765 RepID=A0A2R6NLC0_9APHY|nr:hypothetical protein PHLCEN_2v10957 [Hermanssonia centrifuga]